MDGGAGAVGDGYYDLSREASVAAILTVPKLDVGRIRDLLVKANEMAGTVRSRLSVDSVSEETKELARLNMALLDLVSAVVEKGILPLSSPAAAAASFASVAGTAPPAQSAPSRPRVEPGTAELKAALAAADKTGWSSKPISVRPRSPTERHSMAPLPPALKPPHSRWQRTPAETPLRR
jgi:hypothetical protein